MSLWAVPGGEFNVPTELASVPFLVPCADPVLVAQPTCGEVGTTISVSGSRFALGSVVVSFAGDGQAKGEGPAFTTRLTVPEGTPDGTYLITAGTAEPVRFAVPCPGSRTPVIEVEPTCGHVGSFISVRGSDLPPGGTTVTFSGQPVAEVAGASFATGFAVPANTPDGPHPIAAGPAPPVAFTVPCAGSLALSIEPRLGPPGTVATVQGRDFPPGTELVLSWDPGLGTTSERTDDTGSFTAPVLVFHRDVLGPRTLTASSPNRAGTERSGVAATAEFLVVPATQQPGRFVVRR